MCSANILKIECKLMRSAVVVLNIERNAGLPYPDGVNVLVRGREIDPVETGTRCVPVIERIRGVQRYGRSRAILRRLNRNTVSRPLVRIPRVRVRPSLSRIVK